MSAKYPYKEFERLKTNHVADDGDALITVREGVQLRADYMYYWEHLDANGEVDADVYAELDLGTSAESVRKPGRRKRTARCAIRISILQAFLDAGVRQLSLSKLRQSWQFHIAEFQKVHPIALDKRLSINDVAALCGVSAPKVRKDLHPSPPLELSFYDEVLRDEPPAPKTAIRKISQVESLEINRLEAVYASAPREREALVKIRIGQSLFRDALIDRWQGCSVTGMNNLKLLVASHIKPWSKCRDAEKLDPGNGLLLAPHLDRLFDSGLISFRDDGSILISSELSENDRALLHINEQMRLRKIISYATAEYLHYHRHHVFGE